MANAFADMGINRVRHENLQKSFVANNNHARAYNHNLSFGQVNGEDPGSKWREKRVINAKNANNLVKMVPTSIEALAGRDSRNTGISDVLEAPSRAV